jgi:hypothetical protein
MRLGQRTTLERRRSAVIDRDELDTWLRERDLMLIKNSYFADVTRELAHARHSVTRWGIENERLRQVIAEYETGAQAILDTIAEQVSR